MSDIYDQINQFRAELLRRERQAAAAMVREYGKIWQVLDTRIKSLAAQYYESEQPQLGWLYEQERLESLRSQVEAEMAKFSQYASGAISDQKQQAINLAAKHTGRMIGTYAGFNRLSTEALANLVGSLQPGNVLADYLAGLGSGMGQMVADKLIEGLATGLGAMQIAREIRAAFGANLTSALRTARTEPLRAYREASRQVYQANSDIVGGWIWRSARNERTCGACFAMDGSEHTLDEQLDDHVCGRCFMVPMLPGMKRKETGIEAFGKLSTDQQAKILGRSKYAAFQQGVITLPDLVGRKYDPRWGWMRYEKSLREMGIDWKALKQDL
jgi:hypothetical protein